MITLLALLAIKTEAIRVACITPRLVFDPRVEVAEQGNYPSQLRKMLGSAYDFRSFEHRATVVQTSRRNALISTPEFKAAKRFLPQVVVLEVGPMDSDPRSWDDSADSYVSGVKKIVAELRQLPSKPKILLCLPSPVWDSADSDIAPIRLVEECIVPLLKQTAREESLQIIDSFSLFKGERKMFADSWLLNKEGASLLAEEVYNAVVDGKIAKRNWKLRYASSEETEEGPALNAIDGDTRTYWHSRYSGKEAKYPHEFQIDLGETKLIRGFRYLTRQDGGVNGMVQDYEFYVSQDGKDWGKPVITGSFPAVSTPCRARLAQPVEARYFKFVMKSEAHKMPYASIAELDIIPAAK